MTDQWMFKSESYGNCNCKINCGCQFNDPSTNGYCQSAYIGHIVQGHFNDTPLAGLNWATLYRWPGEVKDGNGKRQIVIDERADKAQRIALEAIISGEAKADLEGRTARVEIPGTLKSRAGPKINEFTGEPFHIALARPRGSFEFTYAELGLGTTSVTGDMAMSLEDTFALFCIHHFNQDGLVRERSRLTAWLGA
jgi:hypothetical protein